MACLYNVWQYTCDAYIYALEKIDLPIINNDYFLVVRLDLFTPLYFYFQNFPQLAINLEVILKITSIKNSCENDDQ